MMPLLGFLDRVVPLLWRATWQAGVLIALIFVIRAMLGSRLAPAWRFALWGVVLVRLLVPVLPSGPLSLFRLMACLGPVRANAFGGAALAAFRALLRRRPVLSRYLHRASGCAVGDTRPVPRNRGRTYQVASQRVGRHLRTRKDTGANRRFCLAGRRAVPFGANHHRPSPTAEAPQWMAEARRPEVGGSVAECQATIGVRFSVVLRVTPDDLGPAVAGLWAPCVLVPQSVLAKASREDVEHILLHELAHVRRRDLVLHWLMTAARVVHWFNPTVQLAAARMQADRELACDAVVLRLLGRERRNAYGVTILKMAGRLVSPWPLPGLVGVFGPQQDLQERIRMIANSKPIGRVWSCVAATLLLAFAVTGLTDAANVAPGDEPPGAKNTVPKVPAETKKDAGSTDQPQALKGREAHNHRRNVSPN